MKKILAFNGSPRPRGNSGFLLERFLEGASRNHVDAEIIFPHELNIEHCRGCLRCNVLGRCSISGDDWAGLSEKILAADILVFASPIYFLHLPGPLKTVIDRFRSFNKVHITESGLVHTPFQEWKKDIVLLLSMGSPDNYHASQVIKLFEYISSELGAENSLHVITATRLAVSGQVARQEDELVKLYNRLELPEDLARADYLRNRKVLADCRELGNRLARN